jgi:hypothetical protein
MRRRHFALVALAGLVIVLGLAGCSNPYATSQRDGPTSGGGGVQNVGEPRAPAPRQAGAQAPVRTQRTPQQAILQFANRYANWTYQTLAEDQLSLASISVGAARLAEQQAATATRADTTLARARIANSGEVLSISPDLTQGGWWVVVTRERTVGAAEYEGLAPEIHIALVQLASVDNGWAISQWLPQS